MKKKITGARRIRLSRETLRQLDSLELALPQGGASIPIRTCEPTSPCTTSAGCTVTACGPFGPTDGGL